MMKFITGFISLGFLVLLFNNHVMALFNQDSKQMVSVSSQSTTQERVVLLHGLGRDSKSMWLLGSRLEDAGFIVHRLEYSSLKQTPKEIITDISTQIQQCCSTQVNTINFVGHSLGGLVIRAYLQQNNIEHLGRVVLIGTPNKGSEVADHFNDGWLMDLLGPTAQSLGTDDDSFPNSLAPPYYPLGVIAGEKNSWLNRLIIPEKNDGLVSVTSAKVSGMTDFVLVETSHSMMRYNSEVAKQAIEYLRHGSFSNTTE